MKKNTADFASLITDFLTDYLPYQRNYSKNTILSYRDTFKLFVHFITEYKCIKLNRFSMADFNRNTITEFLEWLRSRKASVSTTNQRLAALKSFAEYAGTECIENLSSVQSVQNIKSAKYVPSEIVYLSSEQIKLLINKPDLNDSTGLRHRTVLTLLYDSGCRAQELCNLNIRDIDTKSALVHLHGKGNKHRTVTVSFNTAKLVDEYIKRQRNIQDLSQPLLLNRQHRRLSRDGVNYIIDKYAQQISCSDDTFPDDIHAHSFRHSKAMHMLAAGINIVYIRDFLGHEDISTTMIYAKADNRLKNEAITALAPKVTQEMDFPDWTKDQDLLSFLNSLK